MADRLNDVVIGDQITVCIKDLGEVSIKSVPQRLIYYAADAYNQLTGKPVPKSFMPKLSLVSFSERTKRLAVVVKK